MFSRIILVVFSVLIVGCTPIKTKPVVIKKHTLSGVPYVEPKFSTPVAHERAPIDSYTLSK